MKSQDIRINILNNKKLLENVEPQFHGVLYGAVDYQTQIVMLEVQRAIREPTVVQVTLLKLESVLCQI